MGDVIDSTGVPGVTAQQAAAGEPGATQEPEPPWLIFLPFGKNVM